MGLVFLSFALGCSHLPKNSILLAKRQFSACFSKCSHSLNFEAKINCNTTKQNDLKWRKTCTGLKSDLVLFNGPQTKFIRDSLYKHPVLITYFHSPTHTHTIAHNYCPPSYIFLILVLSFNYTKQFDSMDILAYEKKMRIMASAVCAFSNEIFELIAATR